MFYKKWQGQKDSNPRHLVLETNALPAELYPCIKRSPKEGSTFKTEYKLSNPSNHLYWSSPRSISIGQLNTLPCLHLQPINLVIFKGSYFIKNGKSYLEGGFTLRCLQRLSVPYIATQLCSWSATGTPEVRPSRSSRTKDSSSQISCAHNG